MWSNSFVKNGDSFTSGWSSRFNAALVPHNNGEKHTDVRSLGMGERIDPFVGANSRVSRWQKRSQRIRGHRRTLLKGLSASISRPLTLLFTFVPAWCVHATASEICRPRLLLIIRGGPRAPHSVPVGKRANRSLCVTLRTTTSEGSQSTIGRFSIDNVDTNAWSFASRYITPMYILHNPGMDKWRTMKFWRFNFATVWSARVKFSQGNTPRCESSILMKFGINVLFKKIFDPYFFFLSAMVDVEGVKTIFNVEHILLNISEIIEDIVFCVNWWN